MDKCMEESLKAVIDDQLREGRERNKKRDQEILDENGYIRVGFWYSKREPELPKPIVDYYSPKLKAKVLDYLKGGRVFAGYRGFSCCRVCDLNTNGSKDLTDDKYIWPEGLAHYIEEHDTQLPDEFIEHILGYPVKLRFDWKTRPQCPRCEAESGDSWVQCGGVCPMWDSPNYDPDWKEGSSNTVEMDSATNKVEWWDAPEHIPF